MLISVEDKVHKAIQKEARRQTAKKDENVTMGDIVKQLIKLIPQLKKNDQVIL